MVIIKGGSRDIQGVEVEVGRTGEEVFKIYIKIFPEYFVIKILKSADDSCRKMIIEFREQYFHYFGAMHFDFVRFF